MNSKLLFFIVLLQVFVLFIIQIYSIKLTNNNPDESKECIDKLNHSFLTLKFCVWNVSHILVFFLYCIIMKPITLYDHILIFILGIIWFLMQYFTRKNTKGDVKNCPHVVYKNMLQPRLDDFIYNILGQVLYIVYIYFMH
jgi:hypothetical protein